LLGSLPADVEHAGRIPQAAAGSAGGAQAGDGRRRDAARVVRSGSAELAVTEVGSGAAVALLQAGVADWRSRYQVMEVLASRYRLLTYNQRGCGETSYQPERWWPVDDLRAVLDAAGMDRAVLVGCSRGGQVAAEAAFRWQDRVRGLVLVASAPVGAPSPEALPEPIEKLFDAQQAAESAGDTDETNRVEGCIWLDRPLAPEGRGMAAPASCSWTRAAAC
jgi:pimeloyl-ACP methyl ester carboxylesterase